MRQFDTVLIANRGEIACRIIRTLREMGLRSISVYSDADRNARHVLLADQAVHIGASPVSESYLNIDKVLNAAKASGAQAIHPGYGFLSENSNFARRCQAEGLIFIGPSPDAIKLMGDKAVAKRRMIAAGVPCVPGYQGEAQDNATLLSKANDLGFPIMVKAAAGGGGRGMRLVESEDSLVNALDDARSEASNSFGSDVLILERAIQNPRHVEIQIMGDMNGNIIHLGERDCSVQRRHQKVIEETPCPVLTPEALHHMGQAAIEAARSVDYVGAGTVEFMLNAEGNFYFLEMNTRLQVEHPVTEMVTGLDLVALQIRIAQGLPIGLSQEDISSLGHAIEARLYAEDVAQNFLPATGQIDLFNCPNLPHVRVDHGIQIGGDISPYYDPMLAKIIAVGPNRETARQRLIAALKDTTLFGVTTNRSFLIAALSHPEFSSGNATTAFIANHFTAQDLTAPAPTEIELCITAIAQFQAARDAARGSVPSSLLNWRTAHPVAAPYVYGDQTITVTPTSRHSYRTLVGTTSHDIDCLSRDEAGAVYLVGERRYVVRAHIESDATIYIQFGAGEFTLTNTAMMRVDATTKAGKGDIRAPMHGALINIFISVGDSVVKGTRLAVLEAMKMQHELLADIDGTVTEIQVKTGEQVTADQSIFTIENR